MTAVEPGPALVLADGRRIAGSASAGRGRPAAEPRRRSTWRPATCAPATAGIATDRGLRSLTNRRVYAVGDIADPQGIGPRAFTHVGSYHAGIVDPPRAVPPAGAASTMPPCRASPTPAPSWRRSA